MSKIGSLPSVNVVRWSALRKAAVVEAVHKKSISRREALRLYNLTGEEFASWERAFIQAGVPGLRSTRLQQYPLARRPL